MKTTKKHTKVERIKALIELQNKLNEMSTTFNEGRDFNERLDDVIVILKDAFDKAQKKIDEIQK